MDQIQLDHALASLLAEKPIDQADLAIQRNYEEALEAIPETLFPVDMLYIEVTIKGVTVNAFIDTGAQLSIMSHSIARTCGIDHLIDPQHKTILHGVGRATTLGRIHMVDVYLRQSTQSIQCLPCGFTIVRDNTKIDLIIGLDLLLSHGVVLDLKEKCLRLPPLYKDMGENRIDFVAVRP